jgi:TonB-dependent SusC/RagA subfamily outer membrane receptor
MKKYFLHIVLCFCLVASSCVIANAQPQTITVQGKVTDSDNKPIHGVTVAEVDEDGRTIKADRTDVDGNFSLKITNKKHKLSMSHISFKTLEVNIGDKTVFNQTLQSNSKDLGDVVIISQRRADNGMIPINERNLTTAQAHINAKDLEEMQSASIDQALQGRLPGVDITAASGDPGAGMQIRIRGTSSITGSTNPLIVVDGLPYETTIPSDFNFGTSDEVGYAQLLNIAPSDIRDISILKDAAATAVWGSRAANGVVVINTKRGAVSKPVLTYTFKGSLTKQPEAIPMLNGDQ